MLIGIDLDNTIIRYDNSLHKIALEQGLIDSSILRVKRAIRDEVRAKFGDEEWQKLQIAIYGSAINRAELMPGVWNFLHKIRLSGHSFVIVSHKTQYPNYGNSRIDLRKAALDFLDKNKFFSDIELGLQVDDVYFLSTRKQKVQKIKELGCKVFIDDLEEVFTDPDFDPQVKMFLFSPDTADRDFKSGVIFTSFEQLGDSFFIKNGG